MGKNWFTGRTGKEQDLYANFEQVDTLINTVSNVSKNQVKTAREEVKKKLEAINNVNGVSKYVGEVNTDAYEAVFDQVDTSITALAKEIQSKADAIKTYCEASGGEKVLSTTGMVLSKLGEGVLSVFEDIGDGIYSVVGWAAPKDSGLEKWCEDCIKEEWSHDAFNLYYESDAAKKSAITEDSGASLITEIAGQVAGTILLTAATMGVGSGLTAGAEAGAATASAAGKAATVGGKVATTVGGALQSGVGVSTTYAALSGMGAGTEAGLHQGLDINQAAATEGVKQAVINGGIAFVGGKLAVGADKEVKAAKETFKTASTEAEKAAAKETLKDATRAAEQQIYAGGKLSSKAYDAGYNVGYNTGKNLAEKGIVKGTVSNAWGVLTAPVKGAVTGAQNVLTSVKDGTLKTSVETGIKSAGTNISDGAKAVGNAVTHPIDTIKTGAAAAKNAISSAPAAAKTAIANLPSEGAKIATTINATRNEVKERSGNVFKVEEGSAKYYAQGVKEEAAKVDMSPYGYPTTTPYDEYDYNSILEPTTEPIVSNQPSNTNSYPSGGGSTSGGGGYAGGGSTGGGSTGGAPYNDKETQASTGASVQQTTPSDSQQQFQQTEPLPQAELQPVEPTPQTYTPTTEKYEPEIPEYKTGVQTSTPTPTTTPTTSEVVTPAATVPTTTTIHSGGGFSGGGYSNYSSGGGEFNSPEVTTPGLEEAEIINPVEEITKKNVTSIDDIIKGNKYTKIPTSSKVINTTPTQKGSGGSAIIPIAAGLSAAAAAGIGAKAYIDRKNNNYNGEDDFDSEEWSGDDDSLEIDYDGSSDQNVETFDEDDEYGYQGDMGYSARSNEELADLQ